MKNMKKILIAGILAMSMLLVTACGGASETKFDAKACVESFMEVIKSGDTSAYSKFYDDGDEMRDTFRSSITNSLQSALGDVDVKDETKDRLAETVIKMMGGMKYTVSDAVETEEGFDVDVAVEPMKGLFSGLEERMTEELYPKVISGEISQDNMYDAIFTWMCDVWEENLANVSYGEPQTVTVHIIKNESGKYAIKDESETGKAIGALIFDTTEFN